METSQLQGRIDAIPWYHEFDLGDGFGPRSNTPDIKLHRRIWRFIEEGLETVDFRDKTVLDVGCWDGYWSFYAERRGAKSVLATDDFSQNWSSEEGLLLAKELLVSRVQTETRTSVYDLTRHCCHPGTVVCIEGNESIGLPENAAGLELTQGGGKFFPTAGYLHQLLRAAYLSVSSERFLEPAPHQPRVNWRWRRRMCRQALLGSEMAVREAAAQVVAPEADGLKALQRAFLTCSAFEGENALHATGRHLGCTLSIHGSQAEKARG